MKTSSKPSIRINSIQSITMIGMCAAIIAVLSQLSIPLPSGVPVTLQTFAVALTGYLLGWKAGAVSVLIYVLIGCIGVPVFANFKGGISMLFGKTGGFIYGFILMALLCGLAYEARKKAHASLLILLSSAGLLICHLLGTLQFMVLTDMTFTASALLVSIPYLVKDVISVICAYFVAVAIRKVIFRP